MDMDTLLSYDWGKMAPEFTVVITAVVVSLLDLFISRKHGRLWLVWISLAGVAVAFTFLLSEIGSPITTLLYGTYRLDGFSIAFKGLMLIGTGFVLLMSSSYDRKGALAYRGEFYYLLLTALLGAMMMASSADMITLFVSLELLSLSSYILAGLRKNDRSSNEAAFKYVINGGIASAILLFGMSYIYGLTGETNLYEIGQVLSDGHSQASDHAFLLVFSLILVFIGLSFKLATVPFHMWAPDVYEGAPTPVTAFLSVISKTAGFVIVLRLLIVAFMDAPGVEASGTGADTAFTSVQPYIAVLAALAMVIGNTAALRQHHIKRLFAYSTVAHAGYVLVPFVALTDFTLGNIWFYLLAYLFMNLGAFAVIQTVAEKEGSDAIDGFSGLYRRSPWAALAMAVFLVSLAGIPFTAGFIGKFNIFVEALSSGHYGLTSVMIAATVISYFYYFGIMVKMFLHPSSHSGKLTLPVGAGIVVALGVIGTIGFGIFPDAALGFLHDHLPLSELFQSHL